MIDSLIFFFFLIILFLALLFIDSYHLFIHLVFILSFNGVYPAMHRLNYRFLPEIIATVRTNQRAY